MLTPFSERVLYTVEEDVMLVATKLKQRDEANSRTQAHDIEYYVVKEKNDRSHDFAVRRKKLGPEAMAKGLEDLFERWKNVPGFLRPRKEAISKPGTQDVFERKIACARKGCISDPLPMPDMYRFLGLTKELKLPIYSQKGGSGKNETRHSACNTAIGVYSHIGELKIQRMIGLWIYLCNQRNDVKNGLCDEGPGFAFAKLLANERARMVGIAGASPFPLCDSGGRKLNSHFPGGFQLVETFGFDYLQECKRLKRAKTLQTTLDQMRPAGATAGSPASTQVDARIHDGLATLGHRVAAQKLAPVLTDAPVKITTNDEAMLVFACIQEVKKDHPSLKTTGSICAKVAELYMMKYFRNGMLNVGEDCQWSDAFPRLRGKLTLCGPIEKEEIARVLEH